MRVALLTYNARLGDAIGQSVADKLSFFLDHHAEVRVLLEDDRHLHPAVQPYAQRIAGAEALRAAYEELRQADVVLAEYGQYYSLLSMLPGLAELKPRVVVDYHGVTPPELWGPGQRETLEEGVRYKSVLWSAAAILVHSQYTLRELRDRLGIPAERLHHIGFPLDLEHFSPGVSSEPRLSGSGKPLRLPDGRGSQSDATVLLYVGRLAPNKRVPILIEALAALKHRPEVHLLIAGNDGELYQAEAEACRRLAQERGVAERMHFLGQQTGPALRDLYRCADVLVQPSRWETFCLPVVEAMACGLPVVAARATALPETVGDAGLTFTPDDVTDLVRQLERVLEARAQRARTGKVAVVAFRFGTDFVGGAETSLRTMARTLQVNGIAVDVFTTCVRSESNWRDELAEGPCVIDGLAVHRFPIDPHDRPRHLDTVRRILDTNGAVSLEASREYLKHSIHSTALIEELQRRADDFDAVLVGPYLFGLSAAVAQAMGEKTLLVPCFHDEPLARLPIWPEAYGNIGGLLWHSEEERRFAEVDLGFNHPRARTVGTLLDLDQPANPQAADIPGRYLFYCGRYSPEKELPRLFEYFQRYDDQHPGRFSLVCLGQGPLQPPRASWVRDLGFVGEQRKRDVLAGAAALVQLSRVESLSLVALEAWALGVPVLANPACAVLAGHLERCQGGQTIGDFADFAQALDDLWDNAGAWRERGQKGRAYVQKEYGSPAAFWSCLQASLDELQLPLGDCMRRRGLERARLFDRSAWRLQLVGLIESILEAPPLAPGLDVEIRPRAEEQRVAIGGRTVLCAVKITNRGTLLLWPEGPAQWVLRAQLMEAPDQVTETPLPGPLAPGQTVSAMLTLPTPAAAGEYQARIWIERDGRAAAVALVRLTVGAAGSEPCDALLTDVKAALGEAHRLQRLPDDYHDVTQGLLAGLKKRIKSKLLGNFKHAYVDVLSRQQSAFNEQLVRAVAELVECCGALEHAVRLQHEEIRTLKAKLQKRAKRKRKKSLGKSSASAAG